MIYRDSTIYLSTKFTYPENPNIIPDEQIDFAMNKFNFHNGNLLLVKLPFETFAWHPDYINRLAVGDRGTIIDYLLEELIQPSKTGTNNHPKGYYRLPVTVFGGHVLVHILVAKTFIPNPNNYPKITFLDGVPYHYYAWNLQWVGGVLNREERIDILRSIQNGASLDELYKKGYYTGDKKNFAVLISNVRNDRTKWAKEKYELGLSGTKLHQSSDKLQKNERAYKYLTYLKDHPNAKAKEIAEAFGVEFVPSFANHISRIRKGQIYQQELTELGLTLKDINKQH